MTDSQAVKLCWIVGVLVSLPTLYAWVNNEAGDNSARNPATGVTILLVGLLLTAVSAVCAFWLGHLFAWLTRTLTDYFLHD